MHSFSRFVSGASGVAFFVLLAACGPGPDVAALAPNAADAAAAGDQQPIIRGTPTGDDAFGAVGALVTTDRRGRTLSLCTGTLIAPDVVLTAAHCVASRNPNDNSNDSSSSSSNNDSSNSNDWQMWFSNDPQVSPFASKNPTRVAHTQIHPRFGVKTNLDAPLAWRPPRNDAEVQVLLTLKDLCGARTAEQIADSAYWECVTNLPHSMQQALGMIGGVFEIADVAVVVLAQPVSQEALILAHLPTAVTAPLQPKQAMQAVGYGDYGVTDGQLQHGLRHSGTVSLDGIGHFSLQLGFADSQVAMGDSGGPLFATDDVAMEIVGIAARSFIDAQRRIGGPTFYSKTQAYTPWIRGVLREACRDGQRSAQMCKAYPF